MGFVAYDPNEIIVLNFARQTHRDFWELRGPLARTHGNYPANNNTFW